MISALGCLRHVSIYLHSAIELFHCALIPTFFLPSAVDHRSTMVSQGDATAQHGPAGHWSAANPIPTIHKFVENLDKEKKERDQRIDEEIKRKEQAARKEGKPVDQTALDVSRKSTRQVTDPVTGKEIEIEDVQKNYMEESKNPVVSELLSPTACKTTEPGH
jgi:hypothetical protein